MGSTNSVFGFEEKWCWQDHHNERYHWGSPKQIGYFVTVCGEEVAYGHTKANRHISFLPDVPQFYGICALGNTYSSAEKSQAFP